MARLTKTARTAIVDGVRMAARENARETEGVSFTMSDHGRSREYGPEIQDAYRWSVRSIGDSIQSAREWRNYNDFLPRALTAVEAESIVNELLKYGY